MSLKLEAKYESSDGTIHDDIDKWMEYEEKFENPGMPTIRVIGVDRKYHIAESHKDTCLCGVKILSKKENDVNGTGAFKGTIYSCYECTY